MIDLRDRRFLQELRNAALDAAKQDIANVEIKRVYLRLANATLELERHTAQGGA